MGGARFLPADSEHHRNSWLQLPALLIRLQTNTAASFNASMKDSPGLSLQPIHWAYIAN